MKYAQLIAGLIVGTGLGSTVIASNLLPAGGALDTEAVKKIVRETIAEEPKLILESVQKYGESKRKEQMEGASDVLKDKAIRDQVYNADAASVGPKDSQKVVVEFFDYNCPACKFMFKSLEDFRAKDKNVRIIFREFPIFGPVSDTNAKLGLAVHRVYPDKYFAFHEKMMTHEGRTDEKTALGYITGLGMDADKVKAEAATKEVAELLAATHALGEKLRIQGTPTLVIGDQVIPHALGVEELESALKGKAAE